MRQDKHSAGLSGQLLRVAQEVELARRTSGAVLHWEGTGLWAPPVFGGGLPPGRGQAQP